MSTKRKRNPKKLPPLKFVQQASMRNGPPTMSPRQARSFRDICKLQSDNKSFKAHWALLNGDGSCSITIAAQKVGANSTQMVNVPRHVFDKIVDWYMTPQKLRKP